VLCGVGLAALYWWEVDRGGLLPANVPWWARNPMDTTLHVQYACHVALIALMLIGSLIDVDEKVIPDSVTVPGTLIALAAAALYPRSLLPVPAAGGWTAGLVREGGWAVDFLHLTSPGRWPTSLDGFPQAWPLVIGLGCWWMWCVALMHRTWYARHGWARALKLFCVRLRREASTRWILLMGLIGSAGIALVWYRGGSPWQALLSVLVGMAAGGGLVWTIRIIATAVLRREAMGFGDVTLMAMIGAFLGWQPCLVVFFLAPFGALLAGMANLILHRQPEIFYGPFLCLATLVVLVGWASLWQGLTPVFGLGELLVLVILVCLILMVPLLVLSRAIRAALGRFGAAPACTACDEEAEDSPQDEIRADGAAGGRGSLPAPEAARADEPPMAPGDEGAGDSPQE
jgi:leader peptidase (prepilin peptidase)/N-methyltransferase